MRILQRAAGLAAPLDPAVAADEYGKLLISGERVELAYQLLRDVVLLTTCRYIEVDVVGATGRAVRYLTVPYSRVDAFAVESAGVFDLDAELRLWVRAMPPLTRAAGKAGCSILQKFSTAVDVYAMQRLLAWYVCVPGSGTFHDSGLGPR